MSKLSAEEEMKALARVAEKSSTTSLDEKDDDSFMLVASLRSQITDLTNQVTSLNNKLVKSYTQIGDLEDDLHDRGDEISMLRLRVGELEMSNSQWEKEIERGGWVERTHVQTEMQRLMAKAIEEAHSRESAETAHKNLEEELENLTSSLFDEANTMVSAERIARAKADQKLRDLEVSSQIMKSMFDELQASLRTTMDQLEKSEARASAAANPAAGTVALSTTVAPPRLLATVPFDEFVAFLAYLRTLRRSVLTRPQEFAAPGAQTYAQLLPHASVSDAQYAAQIARLTPAQTHALLQPHLSLSTHASQAFVRRCVEEDSDAGLRLDLAPGISFITRRQLSTAVMDGTLVIDPVTGTTAEIPARTCALCGVSLDPWMEALGLEVSTTSVRKVLGNASAFIKLAGEGKAGTASWTGGASTPPTPHRSSPVPAPAAGKISGLLHILRTSDTSSYKHVICPTYCLPRVRAVCELWRYVREIERGILLQESNLVDFSDDEDDGDEPASVADLRPVDEQIAARRSQMGEDVEGGGADQAREEEVIDEAKVETVEATEVVKEEDTPVEATEVVKEEDTRVEATEVVKEDAAQVEEEAQVEQTPHEIDGEAAAADVETVDQVVAVEDGEKETQQKAPTEETELAETKEKTEVSATADSSEPDVKGQEETKEEPSDESAGTNQTQTLEASQEPSEGAPPAPIRPKRSARRRKSLDAEQEASSLTPAPSRPVTPGGGGGADSNVAGTPTADPATPAADESATEAVNSAAVSATETPATPGAAEAPAASRATDTPATPTSTAVVPPTTPKSAGPPLPPRRSASRKTPNPSVISPPSSALAASTLPTTPTAKSSTGSTSATRKKTYEEKCWAHITKRKEAIFWARVSALGPNDEPVQCRQLK